MSRRGLCSLLGRVCGEMLSLCGAPPQLPDADVLPSNPSRWRESSVESRDGWAFICSTRHSHPPVLKYQTAHVFNFFLAFSLSCHVFLAVLPPARGRDPAQDTSRALPAARQTDTSHNSIQQSEQRLCFGIVLGLTSRP